MPVFFDQLNREVNLNVVPIRIISVTPSQTELLFYLGLDQEIIGVTKFCIHPADKFKTHVKVGGTKQLDISKIKDLKPDLIIANKEENERAQIDELMNFSPVWISDIKNLEDATDMINKVGKLVNRENNAKILVNNILTEFSKLYLKTERLCVAYLIWRKPYMVAGNNTFINDMLTKYGLINAFEADRYPEVSALMLINAKPDIVFLSSEPYPFKEKHIAELKAILPVATITLVDGEMFSWYGSRLLKAPSYFLKLLA